MAAGAGGEPPQAAAAAGAKSPQVAPGAGAESPQAAPGAGAESPQAAAESRQAAAIAHFSARAEALLPPEGAHLSTEAADKVAGVVLEAISHPDMFSFTELVSLPIFQKLGGTTYAAYLDVLVLFAFGSYKDYRRICHTIPKLTSEEIEKLKHITILDLLQSSEIIMLDKLMKDIDVSVIKQLRTFLANFCKKLGISGGIMDMQTRTFQVNAIPVLRFHGTILEESLEVFLEEAIPVVCDPNTGLISNDIAMQVKVPLDAFDPSQFYYQVEFKQMGSDIFSQILRIVTAGHLKGRSWNGNIYPGMFLIVGGQVFLRSEAAATRNITSLNSAKDYLAVEAMLKEYTGLRFDHFLRDGTKCDIMYPIYMDDLFQHLNGKTKHLTKAHKADPVAKAMDRNYITFLICHSTFQTTSARSVVLYHVRSHHTTSVVSEQQALEDAVKKVPVRVNWTNGLKNHWLFKGCFTFAKGVKASYKDTAPDCYRLVRDWGTHCRKYLTEQEKLIFTEEVRGYLVEYFFDNFVPEVLYWLLCDYGSKHPNFDLKEWLLKLQRVLLD